MGRIARKKFILLAVLAAAALAAHSCKVPVIEIKTDNLKLNVPLKTGAFNIAAVLSQALKDTFSSGFAIYDMVNYQQSQAFLAGYQMSLLDSFNPDDMHADIKDQMNQMDNIDPGGIDPIYPEPITIPKMTPNSITGELNWFDMSDLFKNMEDQINDTSVPTTTAPFALPAGASGSTIPLPPNVASLPDFMVFEENNPEKANFDSVVVKEGRIELTLKLTPNGGGLDPGVRIELDGIALKGTSSGSLIGAQTALPVILEYPSFSGSFIVDLASADIVKNDAPKFEIGSITFSYTGIQALAQFNLVIQPQIRDIALQGAKGLRIGEMKPDLPDSIADAVRLDNIPGELLNAEIGGGTLTVRAVLPPYKDPATTYCAGFNMEYRICVRQDPVVFEGQEFPGLSGTGGGSWVIGDSGAVTSLSGRTLSGSGMSVVKKADVADPGIDDYSQIIISTGPDGADFELFDNDEYDEVKNGTGTVSAYKDKSLPVKLDMDMEISRLNVVRWKLQSSGGGSVIPVPVIPEIDFGNTGTSGKDISKYVRSISFEEIKLGLDFTVPDPPPAALPGQDALIPGPGLPEALRDRLALRVTCAGFNLNETKILNAGLNEFASDPVRLVLADAGGTAKKLSIEVSLFPVIGTDPDGGIVGTPDENSGYMELGPLDMDAAGGASLAVYGETGFD
ncbi:MAG: hypothetical protein FWH38_10395, partial [Treponema sp.]|nr:hypothetical protein [Treponema sp.]